MARSSDSLAGDEIWGTWEELLLACAVNRHGTRSWDAVAAELRSRSPCAAARLSADTCRLRYALLKRRFNADAGDEIDEPEIPWLDELRKLRVAELRREVQRYDVSIGSLQLKVRKLKEERERSLSSPDDAAAAGDDVGVPGSGSGSDPNQDRDLRNDLQPDKSAGGRVSGEDSGRSCKESNTTEPKAEELNAGRIREEPGLAAANGSRSGSGSGPAAAAAASYNGSSDTIAKGGPRSLPAEPSRALNESGESVAESKGGEEEEEDEEGTKESSDVQSSASLSRRRRRGRRRRGAAPTAEREVASPVREAADLAGSLPLMEFLETLQSSKDGPVFDRRLELQEGVRYRSLIRRHVDLEMVRSRIGRSGYTRVEFFRDLLLLCNNALVFYPRKSPESISAVHLRALINKEIAATLQKGPPPASSQSGKEPTPPPAAPAAQRPLPPLPSKPKPEPERAGSSPAQLPPLAACRKRSFISSKPAKRAKKVEQEEKKEKEEEADEEEDDAKEEKEPLPDKKNTKQRSAVSKGFRTNKARGNSNGGVAKNSNPPKPDPVEQDAKSGGLATGKKKNAEDFLNRMKSSSPSSNEKLVEKGSSSNARRGGGEQLKKKPREEGKKERAAASSTAVKRSVGRPPKRPSLPSPAPAKGKRAREEKTPPLPKKRGRK